MVALRERLAALEYVLDRMAQREYQRVAINEDRVFEDNARAECKTGNGWGQHIARIPLYPLMQLAHRNGENWCDPDYQASIIRKYPQVRVKTIYGTRGQELPKGTIFVPRRYAANR
jgi:hypothetical protein